MPEAMQRRLVMLFCERCQEVTISERHRAFYWRVSDDDVTATKRLFIENGFIDDNWNLLNWNKRQMPSDSSTERTRRYRERQRTSQERHSDALDKNRVDKKREEKTKAASAFELPDWIPVDLWNDYEEMRRKIRKPMTDKARKLAVNTIERLRQEGHSPREVVEQSIFKSWQGLFAPSRNGGNGNGHYETWNERVLRESLAEVDEG